MSSLEDEDDFEKIQDWRSLGAAAQDVIPKRGEKEFAPDGTAVLLQLLEEARDAMYLALLVPRGHVTKQELNAVWYPQFGKAFLPHMKGPYFKDIGHPSPGPVTVAGTAWQGAWLDACETVYLCERGSLRVFMYAESFDYHLKQGDCGSAFDYDAHLMALSLAHLYSVALASPDLEEKYQVYSHLKRLGYLILPFKDCTEIQRKQLAVPNRRWLLSWVNRLWPLMSVWQRHFFDYTSIFRALKLIPAYSTYDSVHDASLPSLPLALRPTFDVWKPTPKFSKRQPPLPDFQVVVTNTNKENFPSLSHIQALFNCSNVGGQAPPGYVKKQTAMSSKRQVRALRAKERQLKLDPAVQKRIAYSKLRDARLKSGGRSFVVAMLDNGVLSFVNFGEGDFRLEHGTAELNEFHNAPHGIVWG